MQPKSVLLTFYTPDMEDIFQVFKAHTSDQFDEVIGYTLESLDKEEWWRRNYTYHKDARMQLPLNPGGAKVGYWKYKSYILLKHMNALPNGSLLVYHDVNVKKYACYMQNIGNLKAMCAHALSLCGADVWMSYENPIHIKVKHHCKAHTVRSICMYPSRLNEYFDHPMLVANRIVVRNTPQMREWMQDIVDLMSRDEYMAPAPDPFRHPEFKWHTGDQSVWNTFFINKMVSGDLPARWPGAWCVDRIMSLNTMVPINVRRQESGLVQ
jgi:hypothetical protein